MLWVSGKEYVKQENLKRATTIGNTKEKGQKRVHWAQVQPLRIIRLQNWRPDRARPAMGRTESECIVCPRP